MSASVKASSKSTGLSRDTLTNEAGQYRFDLLPAGTYEVRVTMKGFATVVVANVELAVSQTSTTDAMLEPSTQAEIVTVESAGSTLVDLQKTDVSTPINTQEIQNLPLNGRDFVNLAYLAPGARPVNSYDPTKNRIGVFSVDGSNGRNVNVTVNGIDDKDNTVGGPVMQLPLEAVQEFNISTQRFSAANGRSEGAAITAITKSGTNEYHGSLYLFDRNQALNANDYFSKQAGNPKSDYGRQQFGGSFGGPIRKDKDFIFFTLERERESTSIITNPTFYNELVLAKPLGAQPAPAIPTPYFDWRYNGRWDHRFSEKHLLFVSYTDQQNNGLNDQSGSNNDLTAGNFTTNRLILASANLNSVFTPTVVNSLTVGLPVTDHVFAFAKRKARAEILGDAPDEKRRLPPRAVEDPRKHRGGSGLTMGTGDYDHFLAAQKLVMQQLRERAEWDALVQGVFEFNIAARNRIAYDYEVWRRFQILSVERLSDWYPQIVEEIFTIMKSLNESEGVSFLLAEQNANLALKYSGHGYILENGRVVLDGSAATLSENEDVKEFYLGVAEGRRKSFREGKHYKRRKRWLA